MRAGEQEAPRWHQLNWPPPTPHLRLPHSAAWGLPSKLQGPWTTGPTRLEFSSHYEYCVLQGTTSQAMYNVHLPCIEQQLSHAGAPPCSAGALFIFSPLPFKHLESATGPMVVHWRGEGCCLSMFPKGWIILVSWRFHKQDYEVCSVCSFDWHKNADHRQDYVLCTWILWDISIYI